ncbi:MAG: hypothetical protein RQ751_05315 [Longimicrobiales bacterium]|nr:hypothetical protein [Longimicrobiales bacterium]
MRPTTDRPGTSGHEARYSCSGGRFALVLLASLATLAVAPPSFAHAQDVDSRWTPWLGCWEAVDAPAGTEVVCVRPGEERAAVVLDYVSDEVEDLVFRADGRSWPVSQAGCEGEERASFSPDGRRVYLVSSFTCDGGVRQSGTGLLAMVTEDEWVEIRSVIVDDEELTWVQRYLQATPRAVEASGRLELAGPEVVLARRRASRPPTLATVAEVARGVDPGVASAWIVESGYAFDLSGEDLLALSEVGVEPEVLDVLVAVSNPDRFRIDAGGDPTPQQAGEGYRTGRQAYGYTPYFGRRYTAFGGFSYGRSSFFFSPYSFSPFGDPYYYGFGGFRPVTVVVSPSAGSGGGGRAVAGRGYVRRGGGGGSSGSPVRSARPSRGGSSSGSAGSARAGSSTSGSSKAGSSRGTRRTAKPRGGGGGGS